MVTRKATPRKFFTREEKKAFEKLGMTRTRRRNGTLLYFSLQDHRFAILGDQGIYDQVGDRFWQEVISTLESYFARGEWVEGLERGICRIGEELGKYFPREPKDRNELADEIGDSF